MAKIIYENLKEQQCPYCSCIFKPTGPAHKNCTSCKKKLTNIERQVSADMERFEKFGTYERVGQGKSQGSGDQSPFWKGGKILLSKRKNEIRREVRYCERCGEDLIDSTRYFWCIHHRDRKKSNQSRNNLELLCKRCHQLEHNCVSNFEGATTTL